MSFMQRGGGRDVGLREGLSRFDSDTGEWNAAGTV